MSQISRETRAAVIQLREDGIIQVLVRPDVVQTFEDAVLNFETIESLAAGRDCPVLINIRHCKPLIPEVRHFYTSLKLKGKLTALALLCDLTPLGQMLGNIYFKMSKHGVPTRLYSDENEAVQWLRICH